MEAFIGSEAIASGRLTRGELRWSHVPVAPDVYLPKDAGRGVVTMARVAWLWSKRSGVIAGRTAAALYGVGGATSSDAAVELISTRVRSRPGFVVRHADIEPDEITDIAGVPVTTAERTALDIARLLPRDDAVVILDRLSAATGVHYADLRGLLTRYRGGRGIERARAALRAMDAGARNPTETRLRLVLRDAGFPTPVTGITMMHGLGVAAVGMGWPELRLSVSVHFPADLRHPCYEFEVGRRQDVLHHYEWIDVPIAPRETAYSIIHRVRTARRDRGARR